MEDDQLMAICSVGKNSDSEAIILTIQRNSAKIESMFDAICGKWNHLTPSSVTVRYFVPDQGLGSCLITLANDDDVVKMYDLHKVLKVLVVKMSVIPKEPMGTDVGCRWPKLDMNCEICRKHAEHLYWDHMEANGMQFFKAMTGDFSQQLQLPQKFVNQFRELSEKTHLKCHGGDMWLVELTNTGNGVLLQSGWKEFVEAHKIEENDILFFTYVGNSCFDIVMCDMSCCEKKAFCYAKSSGSLKRERIADSLRTCKVRSQHEVIKRSSSSSSLDDSLQGSLHNFSKKNKKAADEDQRVRSSSRKRVDRSNRFSIYSKSRRGKNRTVRGSEYQAQQESVDNHVSKTLTGDHPNVYISRTTHLANDEQKRALQLVDAIQLDNPCFLNVMQRSMLSFMSVPSGFKAAANLPSGGCYIFLQVPGRQKKWTVNFFVNHPQMGFGAGWRYFHNDNNLQVGDICLFELTSIHKEVVLTVRISQLAEDESD